MFTPTERILELATELQVPVTLFTDVLCAMRFREWDTENFFRPYERQIGAALKRGHDVQLHLHPHWLTTTFSDGTFLPSQDFALSNFRSSPGPNSLPEIVKRSIAFLSELCRAFDPAYRCVAHRAGGFILAPDTESILGALHANGIRIDSSIAKGYYFRSNLSVVDFRRMPAEANWFISPRGPLNAAAKDGIFEVPIATRPRNPINNVPFLVKRIIYRKRAYRSGGVAIYNKNTSAIQKLGRLIPRSAWMLGFDSYADSVTDALKILRWHIRRHKSDDDVICATVSHPKYMGDHGLKVMREFTLRVQDSFGEKAKFCSFRQIASRLESVQR